MFSFSQSGQDPTRPQAGKCPSVSHDRPSRECDCHSQGTGAGSPRCTQSHYPDPRMRNPPPPPLPRHLAPHRAVTPDPARVKRWNLTGWSSRKWGRAGLIGCRRWMRIPGSSSSEKSEVSAQRRKKRGNVGLYLSLRIDLIVILPPPTGGRLHRSNPLFTGGTFFVYFCNTGARNNLIMWEFFTKSLL